MRNFASSAGGWLKRAGGVGSNLFDRTRGKLTLQYSGVLIVFLTLFVIAVYTLLYGFIWNDQRARLAEVADSEIRLLQQWADSDDNPTRRPPRDVEDGFSLSTDQSFYYLIRSDGEMQLAGETQPELRAQVTALAAENRFGPKRMELAALQTYDRPSSEPTGRPQKSGTGRFLIAERELTWKGERIATLYVGKEVTFQHDLFRYLLVLLVGMALLFFALALWLSHYMARKALVPIAGAYARQREFVADASHELRTPMSVLLTSIEALELETEEGGSEFSRNVLRGMKEEVGAMTKLTGELLHLARTDADGFAPSRAAFDASQAAAAVVSKLRPLAREKAIELSLHAPESLVVAWDAEKLTQLLVLLVDNAIKYTPERGAVQVRLADAAEKGGHVLTIEVQDNGVGISPEALPRIFDRFYRQDKARTRQSGGGHGIGLAIARNIVEAGRGTIRVASKEGEGSTFTVRLPV
ncbi:MAG: ATP-binding protein [Paenibacillaceae bacterium]|nr:ATP-binding protein [Paenibacillaceae bacterium]